MTLRHPRRMLALLAAPVSVTAAQAGGATRALGVTIDSGPSGTVTSTGRDLCVLGARRRRNRRLHVHARPVDGRLHLAEGLYGARTGHPRLRRHCDRRPRRPRLGPAKLDDLAARAHASADPAASAGRADAAGATRATGEASGSKRPKKNLCAPKRALGKPVALGCSALQVVTSTELAKPFADALAKGMSGLGTLGPLKQATPGVVRGLKQGKHLIELGLHEAAHGDVCGGAHTAAAGTKAAERIRRRSRRSRRQGPERARAARRSRRGRRGRAEALWHELGYRAKLVDDAVDAGKDVGAVLQKTCGSIAGKASLHGLVADSGDGSRLLRLANGKAVVLPEGRLRNGLSEGMKTTISGVRFKDGTIYATDVKASSGLGPSSRASRTSRSACSRVCTCESRRARRASWTPRT